MEQADKTTNTDRPPVSIVLLAYNHLDYTRLCVESLYRYTADTDFELITVDNGSSDGTGEFFESLPNSKKLSFPENIGVVKAVNRGLAMADGKYTLNLSNDIVLTANWLKNLVTCMDSDEKIAMAVPVCGFSGNYQQVNLGYQTLDQMQEAAQRYNQSNPGMWEERLRLITYTCLFRADALRAAGGFDEDFNPGAYDDDAISFRLRRAGYKLMLAADTYVHHFGSVTFQAEYEKDNLLERNRNLFIQKFGVDPWVASAIDYSVVSLVYYRPAGLISMLGIGQSCGSTLLQIKNMHRRMGVQEVCLDYLSEDDGSLPDLRTICRDSICAPLHAIGQVFGGRAYDIIIVESDTDKMEDAGCFYEGLCDLLKPGGQLITTAAQTKFPVISEALTKKGLAAMRCLKKYYYNFTKKP